ncbi:hypothetical protein [Streptosporangium sp. NPDC000509]|uniref:hypothetical protein n=1 Tax=Streptosporangium sp. NPDC000509 TaxID=3366186 RepID=UPI0036B72D94
MRTGRDLRAGTASGAGYGRGELGPVAGQEPDELVVRLARAFALTGRPFVQEQAAGDGEDDGGEGLRMGVVVGTRNWSPERCSGTSSARRRRSGCPGRLFGMRDGGFEGRGGR